MFVFVLTHLLQGLHFRLQLIDLPLLLLYDALKIEHTLQSHLIGLFRFVFFHCLLQSLNYLICILELHAVALLRYRVFGSLAVLLQLVLSSLLQLLIQTHRKLFQFASQLPVLLEKASLVRYGGRRRLKGRLSLYAVFRPNIGSLKNRLLSRHLRFGWR